MTSMNHEQLCRLIPHSGQMCLLETVESWDPDQVHCTAISHRQKNNPLRHADKLQSICAVEYAAQAMAVHGGLLATHSNRPSHGYITSIRDVRLYVEKLDDVGDILNVFANRLSGDDQSCLYDFQVKCEDTPLVEGRILIYQVYESR